MAFARWPDVPQGCAHSQETSEGNSTFTHLLPILVQFTRLGYPTFRHRVTIRRPLLHVLDIQLGREVR
jgi:hypothetical protein